VLLHIGPHKTGTTAIQTALRDAQPVLRQHGVEYVGPGLNPHLAALYATGRPPYRGQAQPKKRYWRNVVQATTKASGKRVAISSERFCPADIDRAKRIVRNLGGDRVNVVITLRPLSRILASQWQQRVQLGVETSFNKWLRAIFDGDQDENPAKGFWERHDHGELVERWSQATGVERLIVVVVDDEDRQVLTNAFEQLLDVPAGCLVPERGNRSLTMSETEVIRQLNHEYVQRQWSPKVYRRYVINGAAAQFKYRPIGEGETGIATPRWAAERAAERAEQSAQRIRALGVPVIGDLSQLTRLPAEMIDSRQAQDSVIPTLAATAGIVGAILAAEEIDPNDQAIPDSTPPRMRRAQAFRRAAVRLRDDLKPATQAKPTEVPTKKNAAKKTAAKKAAASKQAGKKPGAKKQSG
jgi:hypothetical protein